MAESLVVGSKVKAYIKSKNMKSSSDVQEGLTKKVTDILNDAITRCKANKRSTVRPCDL